MRSLRLRLCIRARRLSLASESRERRLMTNKYRRNKIVCVYLRFGFDRLQLGHIVRWDVALQACLFAARQPPVALKKHTQQQQ